MSISFFIPYPSDIERESPRAPVPQIRYVPSQTQDSEDEPASPIVTVAITDEFVLQKQNELSSIFNSRVNEKILSFLEDQHDMSTAVLESLNQANWYDICRATGPAATAAGVAAFVLGGPLGVALEQVGTALSAAGGAATALDRREEIQSKIAETLSALWEKSLTDPTSRGVYVPSEEISVSPSSSDEELVVVSINREVSNQSGTNSTAQSDEGSGGVD